MAIFSIREFGDLTGIAPKNIHAYCAQGKLEKSSDKKIDTSVDKNRLFLEKKGIKYEGEKIEDVKTEDQDQKKTKGATSLLQVEFAIKKLTANKLEKECRLKDIEIRKKSGDLIPVDAVISIFLYSVETFKNKYLQEAKSISSLMVKMMDGTHDDLIRIQKQMTEIINENYREVKSQLIDGVDGIVEEYKEVRSRGEKK